MDFWTSRGIAIVGLSLALVSCRSEEGTEQKAVEEDEQALEEVEIVTDDREVNVILRSYEIEMPAVVPAGEVVFRITNEATDDEHSFVILSEDMTRELDERVPPGGSAELRVTLEPGSYYVRCPVGNHEGLGMQEEVTAVESPPSSP